MTTYPHEWVLNEDGSIDLFALDEGFHNGPECTRCNEAHCHHCCPDWMDSECPVAARQPTLFEENND